jgi:hypothetical protein
MRLGQQVCEIIPLLSDPEIRIAIVPLKEKEYQKTLALAASLDFPETAPGQDARDEFQKSEVLSYAIREPDDLDARVYASGDDLAESLDAHEINNIFDVYLEMVNNTSPAIDGLSDADFDTLKKVLRTMSWNELSGQQWYAAKRFLLSIFPNALQDNSLGFSSSKPLITTNGEETSISNASESLSKSPAKSAESLPVQ